MLDVIGVPGPLSTSPLLGIVGTLALVGRRGPFGIIGVAGTLGLLRPFGVLLSVVGLCGVLSLLTGALGVLGVIGLLFISAWLARSACMASFARSAHSACSSSLASGVVVLIGIVLLSIIDVVCPFSVVTTWRVLRLASLTGSPKGWTLGSTACGGPQGGEPLPTRLIIKWTKRPLSWSAAGEKGIRLRGPNRACRCGRCTLRPPPHWKHRCGTPLAIR